MGTREKLIERFKRQPKDFTWQELIRLLGIFGFEIDNKGKTSGSRTVFVNNDDEIEIHRPHPSNIIKGYIMKNVLKKLIDKEYIKKEE
jgi:hypothetical protein